MTSQEYHKKEHIFGKNIENVRLTVIVRYTERLAYST